MSGTRCCSISRCASLEGSMVPTNSEVKQKKPRNNGVDLTAADAIKCSYKVDTKIKVTGRKMPSHFQVRQ